MSQRIRYNCLECQIFTVDQNYQVGTNVMSNFKINILNEKKNTKKANKQKTKQKTKQKKTYAYGNI